MIQKLITDGPIIETNLFVNERQQRTLIHIIPCKRLLDLTTVEYLITGITPDYSILSHYAILWIPPSRDSQSMLQLISANLTEFF